MNPAITILDYLWSIRNWLKHHPECSCSFEKLSTQHIELTMTVDQWAEVVISTNFGAIMREKRLTADEWNEICGPAAETEQISKLIEEHVNEAGRLMALQATKERLKGD